MRFSEDKTFRPIQGTETLAHDFTADFEPPYEEYLLPMEHSQGGDCK
jgi:hypothetical protein